MLKRTQWLKNIGMDLGTANTILYVSGKGYIVNEPSFIAYEKPATVLAVGKEARRMFGKTPANVRVLQPLADGVIADFLGAEAMIKAFIRLADIPKFLINRAVIGVPSGITPVEMRAVIDSALATGVREAALVHEPMAAAIGLGLDIFGPDAHMIVDIGGGTTDIAVITYGGLVVERTLRIAGDEMTEALARYFKQRYRLVIGYLTAEEIKMTWAQVTGNNKRKFYPVRGTDFQTNLPRRLQVSNTITEYALSGITNMILEAIRETLEKLPPELAGDILDRGLILTGGGSLIKGLDIFLRKQLQIPVSRAENALLCVAEGTRKILENFDYYRAVLIR